VERRKAFIVENALCFIVEGRNEKKKRVKEMATRGS